ncbi:hypothetical protein GC163_09840 [bacterium]|nr:hypothetical protein [bacterium]
MIPTRWKPVVIGAMIGLLCGVIAFDLLNTLLCAGARERLLERQIALESTQLFLYRDGLRATYWPVTALSGATVCGVFGYATTAKGYHWLLACGLGLGIAASTIVIVTNYLKIDYGEFLASVEPTTENALSAD